MQATSIKSVFLSALAGWLAVLAVSAAFNFFMHHPAPEFGSPESFLLLSIVLTLYFAVAFCLVVLPALFLFGARIRQLWFLWRAFIGTVLLGGCTALSAPFTLNLSSPGVFIFIVVLASAAGFACFAVIPHAKKSQVNVVNRP